MHFFRRYTDTWASTSLRSTWHPALIGLERVVYHHSAAHLGGRQCTTPFFARMVGLNGLELIMRSFTAYPVIALRRAETRRVLCWDWYWLFFFFLVSCAFVPPSQLSSHRTVLHYPPYSLVTHCVHGQCRGTSSC